MDERIHQMVEAWDMAAIKPTPEELCADCPELLPELKQALASLAAADGLLGDPNRTTAAEPSSAGPPILIPGYKILHRVGQGGQAVVYAAIKENTGRKVAVKVLLHGAFVGPQGRARFDREVSILATLHHPNIVMVIDRGVTPDGSLYIVMDFIEGMSLDKHIAALTPPAGPAGDTQGPPDRGLMLVLFSKICDAIQAAHEQGVIHRDLKPSNILIDERGEPHILDFGIARSAVPDAGQRDVSITDQFLGTLAWASPEQADSRPLDHRTDIYSLGLILYYMLTGGKFPYNVLGPMARVLNNILQAQPIPPSMALAPNPARRGRTGKREYLPPEPPLNPAIESIVLKVLSKKPQDRYSSAKEMAEAIRKYLTGLAESSRTHATPRKGVPWAALAIAALVVVVGTVIVKRKMRPDPLMSQPLARAGDVPAATRHASDEKPLPAATQSASWPPATPGFYRLLEANKLDAPSMQFFADGRRLMSTAGIRTVIFDLATGSSKEFDKFSPTVSSDGRWLRIGPDFVNADTWQSTRSVDEASFERSAIVDKQYISFWSSGMVAAVLDLGTPGGRFLSTFPKGTSHVLYADGGRHVIATDANLMPHIYDVPSMQELASFDTPTYHYPAWAISPDGQTVEIPTVEGDQTTFWLWQWKTGKKVKLFSYPGHDSPRFFFLPTGPRMIWVRNDGANRSFALWDLSDISNSQKVWEQRADWYGYFGDVKLSPDGSRIVACIRLVAGSVVLVLDANTGTEIARYFDKNPGFGPGAHLAISPDGRLAASAGMKGPISIWRLPDRSSQPPTATSRASH